jgi:hypothetical protein
MAGRGPATGTAGLLPDDMSNLVHGVIKSGKTYFVIILIDTKQIELAASGVVGDAVDGLAGDLEFIVT